MKSFLVGAPGGLHTGAASTFWVLKGCVERAEVVMTYQVLVVSKQDTACDLQADQPSRPGSRSGFSGFSLLGATLQAHCSAPPGNKNSN